MFKKIFQAMTSTENEAMEVDEEEEDAKVEVKLGGIKIGQNLICQLTAENAGRNKKVKGSNRIPILILDCSGSMGHWVQRSVDAWQRALRAQQYTEDQEVHMIEFESSTVMTHHKLKNLDSLNMHSRGGTSMAGVVSKLETLLINLIKPESRHLWKALLANTLYWSVRRSIGDADRSEIIRKLLSIDSENFTHPLPDDQEEPTSVSIHDMWDEQTAEEYMNKHKNLYVQKLFKNLLGLANAFKAVGCKTSPEIFNQDQGGMAEIGGHHILGMEFNLFCLVEVVKSIETLSKVDRYGEGSIGFPESAEEATAYLKALVRELYRQQYDTELKLKLERVKNMRALVREDLDEGGDNLNTLADAKEVLNTYGSNECDSCEAELNQKLISLDAAKNPNFMEEAKEIMRQKNMLQS